METYMGGRYGGSKDMEVRPRQRDERRDVERKKEEEREMGGGGYLCFSSG
jgi:hypothetical protein